MNADIRFMPDCGSMLLFLLRRREELKRYYVGDPRAEPPATAGVPAGRSARTLAEVDAAERFNA